MGILSGKQTRMASVRSIDNSIILVILSFAIENLKQSHPEIILKIQKIIDERKKQNSKKLLNL
jgi:CRP-like cAMP-binding protein